MANYKLESILNQVRHDDNVNDTFSLSYHKVIIYNDGLIRFINYEMPVFYNFVGSGGRRIKSFYDLENGGEADMEIRRKTINLICKTVYALGNSNFKNDDSKFVSLVPPGNIIDVQEANKYFKKFISRMRRNYGVFDYLAVIHFQKKNSARVHYHVLWNLPYIPQKKLLDIWGYGQGSVFINKIWHVDNLGAYILGYMGKTVGDKRLLGNKAYLCSKGLKRPVERHLDDLEYKEMIKNLELKNKKISYHKEYQTENYGLVEEFEYNLNRK